MTIVPIEYIASATASTVLALRWLGARIILAPGSLYLAGSLVAEFVREFRALYADDSIGGSPMLTGTSAIRITRKGSLPLPRGARLEIEFSFRPKHRNLMGRFGGGWNVSLGIEIGSTTVIVNLFVCMLRVHYASAKYLADKFERESKRAQAQADLDADDWSDAVAFPLKDIPIIGTIR